MAQRVGTTAHRNGMRVAAAATECWSTAGQGHLLRKPMRAPTTSSRQTVAHEGGRRKREGAGKARRTAQALQEVEGKAAALLQQGAQQPAGDNQQGAAPPQPQPQVRARRRERPPPPAWPRQWGPGRGLRRLRPQRRQVPLLPPLLPAG